MGNGTYGYGSFPGKSLAVTLETNGESGYSGYYTDANYGGGSVPTYPVNFFSGDPINASLTYNGTTLQESFLDTKTLASYSNTFLILTPFQTVLGGSTAYVGLSVYCNSAGYADDQSFSNLQFTSAVPEPSTFALLGVGTIGLLVHVRRRARRPINSAC